MSQSALSAADDGPRVSLAEKYVVRCEGRGWLRRDLLRRFDWWAMAALVAMTIGFWYSLGVGDLKDWDESVYAWRALIIHELGGRYWLDQAQYAWLGYYSASFPPILVWTSAIAFKFLGPTELAHRLFCCACGCGAVFALYFLGRSTRSRTAGLLAAFALASIYYWVRFARRGQFDVPFVCFTVATLAFYAEALFRSEGYRQRRMLLWAGAMLGLGLMTKILITGILAGGTAFLFSIYLLATRRRSFKSLLADAGWMLLPAAIIAAPWHIAMTFVGGWDFWNFYIGFHLLDRATQVLDEHLHPWHYYFGFIWSDVPMVIRAAAFLGFATLCAVVFFGRFGSGRRFGWFASETPPKAMRDTAKPAVPNSLSPRDFHAVAVFLLIVAAFPLVLYMSAKTRRDAYFLPMIPGIALLAGVFVADLLTAIPTKRECIGILFLYLTLHLWSHRPEYEASLAVLLLDEPDQLFSRFGADFLLHTVGVTLAIATAIVAAIGLAGYFLPAFGRRLPYVVALTVLAIFLYKGYEEGIQTQYDRFKSKRTYGWQRARPLIQERVHDSVIFFSNYFEPARAFYLYGADHYPLPGTHCTLTQDREQFAKAIREQPNPLIIIDALVWRDFLGAPELNDCVPIHEGGELHLFAKRGSPLAERFAMAR